MWKSSIRNNNKRLTQSEINELIKQIKEEMDEHPSIEESDTNLERPDLIHVEKLR